MSLKKKKASYINPIHGFIGTSKETKRKIKTLKFRPKFRLDKPASPPSLYNAV